MKNNTKYKIWTVVFLVIVVCASTAMLNVMYANTKPLVERNERIKLEQNILDVFDIPYNQNEVEKEFKDHVTIEEINGMKIYRSADSIAFEITGSGFWDKISILLALEYDMETIKAIRILKNNETPGLGSRINEKWFLDQFAGKSVMPEIKIISHKKIDGHNKTDSTTSATYSNRSKNEVDAITGATETSKALEKLINNGVRIFNQKTSSEGNN